MGDLKNLQIIGDTVYRSQTRDVYGQTVPFTQHFGYPGGAKNGRRYLGPQVRKVFPTRVGDDCKAEWKNVERLF